MKKFTTLKTLLVGLLALGATNAWGAGYTRTLTDALDVAGYTAKQLYDFQNNNPEVLPTTGDLRYRAYEKGGYWGFHNFGGGGRSGAAAISVSEGDIIVLQHYNNDFATLDCGSLNNTLTSSTGYQVYDITKTVETITFTVARNGGIVAALVMEKDASVQTAGYTINYKYNGETITSDTGSDIALGTVIKAAKVKWVEDVKYILADNQVDSLTIASGSNVLDVNVRLAEKYHYVLNAVNESEEVIKKLDEGDAFEGEKGYTHGVKAFYLDGTLYSTNVVDGFEKEFSKEGTETITYGANTTWALFTEVEDMTVSHSWAADGVFPAFYSNGRAVRFYKGSYAYTKPLAEGGTYKVTMWARNNSGTSSANVGLYYRDAEGLLVSVGKAFEDWAKAQRVEKTVEGVGIPAGCSFVIKNDNADYNNNLEMDYIFLEKTSDEAPALENRAATIGSNGYSTFASAYAVEIPSGVTAYTAKVNETGTAVNFTKIEGTAIPANTGVLLEGTPGDITLTVVESASPLTDNDFIAGTGAAPSDNTKTYFAMVKNSDPLAFGKIAADVVVPANKAYLAVAASAFVPESARLTVTFDGEATGIKTVENAKAGKAIYNLNGQRVDKAQKGLYIVNGKKTIVK